jgi:hypothetical protein
MDALSMLPMGPRELIGKTVRRPDGESIGIIKGLHQTTCNGCFDEISIECVGGPIFAPMAALLPDGGSYILVEDALIASPALNRPAQVPVALPVAIPASAGSPVQSNFQAPSAPNVLTVQELTLTAIPALTPDTSSSVTRHGAVRIAPMPSVSLRTRMNGNPVWGKTCSRTAPLTSDKKLRSIVANLEPPKPHARAQKKKQSKKRSGNERPRKVSIRGARSFFNLSTILQRFI